MHLTTPLTVHRWGLARPPAAGPGNQPCKRCFIMTAAPANACGRETRLPLSGTVARGLVEWRRIVFAKQSQFPSLPIDVPVHCRNRPGDRCRAALAVALNLAKFL